MIGFLKGNIISKKPTEILLDVNGVGYLINITTNTFEDISKSEQVSLFIYLSVREDALTLYGFSTASEKEMFKLLIGVNGIGPKLAQSILSGIRINDLQEAINSSNVSRLVAIPGIGKKTAERMLIELRDKVDIGDESESSSGEFKGSIKHDAVSALTSLGYPVKTAENLIRSLLSSQPELSLEELLRKALGSFNN